jgi:hypothetical protein
MGNDVYAKAVGVTRSGTAETFGGPARESERIHVR